LLFSLMGLAFTLAAAPAPRPPNIVVILGDDIVCSRAPVFDRLRVRALVPDERGPHMVTRPAKGGRNED
jgi:hypothetical protein